MPINTPIAAHSSHLPAWKLVRDVIGGSRMVKAAGTEYLPMLDRQSSDEYEAYKRRALFLPVVGRTVSTMVGLALYREPHVEVTSEVEEVLSSLGNEGEPLLRIVSSILRENISIGRVLAVVDPGVEEGSTPNWSLYTAENFINWRTAVIDGEEVISMIVVRETRNIPNPEDEYETTEEEIFREFRLGSPPILVASGVEGSQVDYLVAARTLYGVTADEIAKGVYYQAIWSRAKDEKGKPTKQWQIEEVIVPSRKGGRTLSRIPAVIFNSDHLGSAVSRPPLEDLATINISHYLNSADLEHGRHFTALPTAWLAGFDMKGELRIGSSVAWVSDNPQARAGYLEFAGTGLGHLQTGLTQKEQLMAVIGVRFLEAQRSVEKPEAIRLRQIGDHATLSEILDVVEEGVVQLLEFTHMFMRAGDPAPDSIKFQLSRQFGERHVDPALLEKLIAAVQGGLLSWATFIDIFARSGILPEGVDADEEARRILAGLPGGMAAPGGTVTNEEESEDAEDPEPREESEEADRPPQE